MTLNEHLLVEEILAEANAYGMKEEVQRWAYKFIDEGYGIEEAYQMAFQEWCK